MKEKFSQRREDAKKFFKMAFVLRAFAPLREKIFRNVIVLFFLLPCFNSSFAQDIHFSQFNASPMNLNPSLTAAFDGDYRIVLNHKNQWSSIPAPFKTFSLSADTKLPFKIKNDQVGLGMLINTDKAGATDFKTFQAALSLSYLKRLTQSQLISFGIQTGITNKSFDPGKMTFDSQYNGDNYDPSIASGENTFSTTGFSYFDFSAGAIWFYKIKERTQLSLGGSYFHINQPGQSFFSDKSILLDPKLVINSSFHVKVAPVVDLIPAVLFEKQGRFYEMIVGTSLKYILLPQQGYGTAIYGGCFYRGRDAFIVSAGMEYNKFNVGMSYDINNSTLSNASRNRGGFEISLIYIVQKFVAVKSNKKVCPVFM